MPVDCLVVHMMDGACARAENNIAQLPTKPSFFFEALHRRARTLHAQTHTHSLAQAGMCSAQPVITAALMWSLGGTEASYYCRFMTTFTLLLHSPPSLSCSLALSFPPWSVPPDPASNPPHPTPAPLAKSSLHLLPHPNPHPFLLLLPVCF